MNKISSYCMWRPRNLFPLFVICLPIRLDLFSGTDVSSLKDSPQGWCAWLKMYLCTVNDMFLENWERGEHVFVLGKWEEKNKNKMELKKDHTPSPYNWVISESFPNPSWVSRSICQRYRSCWLASCRPYKLRFREKCRRNCILRNLKSLSGEKFSKQWTFGCQTAAFNE